MTREEVIAIAREHQQWDPRDDENKRNINTALMRKTYAAYFGMSSTEGYYMIDLVLAFYEDRPPVPFNDLTPEEQDDTKLIAKVREFQELLTDGKLT